MKIITPYSAIFCLLMAFCLLPFTQNVMRPFGDALVVSASSPAATAGPASLQAPQRRLDLIVSPDPIPQSSALCEGVGPSWTFTATVSQSNGVPVTVTQVVLELFDQNSRLINSRSITGGDLSKLFSGCGTGQTVLPPNGQICANTCVNLNGRPRGFVAITIFGSERDRDICPIGTLVKLDGPTLNQGADLIITKASSTGTPRRGTAFFYTLKVTNAGPGTATGVTVTDRLPAGTAFRAAAVSQGTFTPPSGGASTPLTFFLNSIPPGASAMVWIVVSADFPPGTTLTNIASVTSTSLDPSPGDNSVEHVPSELFPNPGGFVANLSITNTASPERPEPGSQVTYTITVRNNGPDGSLSQSIINLLPPGTTFSSIVRSKGGGDFTPPVGGRGIIISPISLLPGEVETITIKANVIVAPNTQITNRVELVDGSSTQNFAIAEFNRRSCTIPLLRGSVDPDQRDDLAMDGRTVRGGGIVMLSWEQPPSTPANPTPAPRAVRVNPGTANPEILLNADDYSYSRSLALAEGTCTLVGYNIFSSQGIGQVPSSSPIQMVPPSQTGFGNANSPVSSTGSNYIVSAIWNCPSGQTESMSEQVGVPAGPLIESVSISSKLKIKGANFSGPVEVTVDGVRFKKTPKVKGGGTEVLQKGKLIDGRSLSSLLGPGKSALLSIRNANGGISSYRLSQ